jgi:exopolyphosphatase/guanosine-5'-triphosphate,3'-diphosphate pyrophosphatase
MPGFSRADQDLLAAMLLGQRKKLTRESSPAARRRGRARPAPVRAAAPRRPPGPQPQPAAAPAFTVDRSQVRLELSFPADWIEGHPLTLADLIEEASKIQGVGFELKVR